MDAQGRGRADNIDPADQWVLNPRTGEYELRLSSSAPQPAPPSAPQPAVPSPRSGTRGAGDTAGGGRARGRTSPAPGREVPPQRRRRAAPEEPPPGRRGRRPAKGGSKGKKVLMWTGGTTAFVVLTAGVGGYLYLKHLEGNVSTTDVGDAGSSSFSKDEAFNILVIGTDKRTGAGNEGYGD
ncbi:LytR family transcriptional regulator, partial [Streptomyces sp. TRM S81-3]|nr:LytR family transcriptional regulator [Streptomyces griseicoloratus]